ncbi:isoleucine--tRNA ligase [Mycoplasmopsis synoviae]|uniref:isoleucine--tRNA ligase n=1 Tax=Mycoplasmopsis synoviae TaxID=2109 RepID=UPI003BA0A521
MSLDFKKTLNMPSTKFDMKANLVEKEPLFRKKWLEDDIYQKVLKNNANNERFVVHDGPPYANGDIHVGHALNKILKDIIVRYKSLQGYYSPFVPGWDTHGLPIEHKMLTESKLDRDQITVELLRKKSRNYALKQIEHQKKQFQKLQLFSDFSKIYITLDKSYEAKQLKVFKKLALDGLVYKGLKPIYWSPSSQSALAEAEVEYETVTTNSIYVSFDVTKSTFNKVPVGSKLVVWTTTPWTLIANAAVAISFDITYLTVKYQDSLYVVAKSLFYNDLLEKFQWENYEVVDEFLGKEMPRNSIWYKAPLLDFDAPVIATNYVLEDSGTGLVHSAPLFGEDDFSLTFDNDLKLIMHISDTGHIENSQTKYDSLFYEEANKEIIKDLAEKVVHVYTYSHSYPHDWRTKKPIIYRATPQWFVSIDKVRSKIVSELQNKVKTFPEWSKNRMISMIENRGDWTISRQRTWGVPIIIFYDENEKPVINEEIFDHVIDLVANHGTDIWFSSTVDELLPEKYRNRNWTKENDIMDVWFDSGVSSIAVDIDGGKTTLPFDVYLEGYDQFRGWFNSSVINAVAYAGVSPYINLVSHGFALDGQGKKMSKSRNNVVDPLDVIKKYGADILRLWVANSEYSSDVHISESILVQNSEIYRKIRNTVKFLLGNLNNFKYDKDLKLTSIHHYINEELKSVKKEVLENYDKFRFINVIKVLNRYVIDLSSFYLSVTKDILYIRKENDEERQMVLKNFYEILDFLMLALAPIIPTTADEMYSYFNKENKKESLFLERLEKAGDVSFDEKVLEQFKEFFELRDQVNILIENQIQNKVIKRSNELELVLPETASEFLKSLDLKTLLMVSKISYGKTLQVVKFESEKCKRCWNHFASLNKEYEICDLCFSVLKDTLANA